MPKPSDYNLDFRPHSYWGPQDLETHYNSRIKGELRRAAAPGQQQAGLGGVDVLESSLSEEKRSALGGWHPWLMGGEYLPNLLPNEVEIARVVMKSTTMDVISIRARHTRHRIKYRIVDEYPKYSEDTCYVMRPASTRQPLTLKQLIDAIDLNHMVDKARNWNYVEGDCTPEEIYDFCTVSSAFYPELKRWFDEVNEEWLQTERARLKEEDEEEDE